MNETQPRACCETLKTKEEKKMELYEKQEDGTLKPIDYPSYLVMRLNTYLWLKGKGLTFEEICYILESQFI